MIERWDGLRQRIPIAAGACIISATDGAAGLLFLRGLIVLVCLILLFMAARRDLAERRIPDRISLCLALLGAAALWLFPEHGLADRLAGAVLVAGPMFLLAFAFEGAFGGGDIKLMAAGGFLLGWRAVALGGLVGIVSAGICCVVLLAVGKLSRKDRIPFGPFLAIGLAAGLFLG